MYVIAASGRIPYDYKQKSLCRVMCLHPPVEITVFFLVFACQELGRTEGSAGSVGGMVITVGRVRDRYDMALVYG